MPENSLGHPDASQKWAKPQLLSWGEASAVSSKGGLLWEPTWGAAGESEHTWHRPKRRRGPHRPAHRFAQPHCHSTAGTRATLLWQRSQGITGIKKQKVTRALYRDGAD